jgi:hypothetical protein
MNHFTACFATESMTQASRDEGDAKVEPDIFILACIKKTQPWRIYPAEKQPELS